MSIDTDTCEVVHMHPDMVEAALKSIPSDDTTANLARMFKLLSDPARLKIVLALMENELCVCDISNVVGMSQSAASHQLRVLRSSRLARFSKRGKLVYYSIDDEHVASVIKMMIAHINHE